jgi:hypothetical protein
MIAVPNPAAAKWLTGTSNPNNPTGVLGDWFLNTATYDIFEKTGTNAWTARGNIRGAASLIRQGTAAPANSLGVVGDWFINTSNFDMYEKTGSNAWTNRGNIRGGAGASIYFGTGTPANSLGAIGDMFINTTTFDFYEKTAATTWTIRGNIKGAKGDQGDIGGKWHQGITTPAGTLGTISDWFLNTVNWDVYEKTAATIWTLRGNILGAQGPTGGRWYQGTSTPAGTLGLVGDWFVNTNTYDFYEKTGTSAWTSRGNLRGAQGDAGSKILSGTAAPAAGTGAVGDWYINTTTWDMSEKTSATAWTIRLNIRGGIGLTGSNSLIRQGTAAPGTALGIIGDWFINTNNWDMYEKTAATTWTLRGNIKGAAGADGARILQGTAAPASGTGLQGDWFINTATWDMSEKTSATVWTLRGNIKGLDGATGGNGFKGQQPLLRVPGQ